MEHEIALYTLEGVKDADISTHYFNTDDKLGLNLLRFHRQSCDDVVLLIHGLTASSDMFIMPEHYNLVQYLLCQIAIDCRICYLKSSYQSARTVVL